jgi:hypothetical protein
MVGRMVHNDTAASPLADPAADRANAELVNSPTVSLAPQTPIRGHAGRRQDPDVNQRRCGAQGSSGFSKQCGADQRRNPLLTHSRPRIRVDERARSFGDQADYRVILGY